MSQLSDIPHEVLILIFLHFHPKDAIRIKRTSRWLYNAMQEWLPFGFYRVPLPIIKHDLNSAEDDLPHLITRALIACDVNTVASEMLKVTLDTSVEIEALLGLRAGGIRVYSNGNDWSVVDLSGFALFLDGTFPEGRSPSVLESDDDGNPPLVEVARSRYAACNMPHKVKCVRHLVKTGCISNTCVVMWTISQAIDLPTKIIKKLIKPLLSIPGVDIDATDPRLGTTALHFVCAAYDITSAETVHLVIWLILHGSDPMKRTTPGCELLEIPEETTAFDILLARDPSLCAFQHKNATPTPWFAAFRMENIRARLDNMRARSMVNQNTAYIFDALLRGSKITNARRIRLQTSLYRSEV